MRCIGYIGIQCICIVYVAYIVYTVYIVYIGYIGYTVYTVYMYRVYSVLHMCTLTLRLYPWCIHLSTYVSEGSCMDHHWSLLHSLHECRHDGVLHQDTQGSAHTQVVTCDRCAGLAHAYDHVAQLV